MGAMVPLEWNYLEQAQRKALGPSTRDRLSSWPPALVSLESGLLLDGPLGQGLGLEALVGDTGAAFNRHSVGAQRDARFGTLDGREFVPQGGCERLIDKLVLEFGADLAGLAGLVEIGGIFGLLLASKPGKGRLDATALACYERSRP
jgi:hypothetical protein